MLRALIFDVDGTLADTERDGHRVAFNRAFAEHGLGWNWDEARYGELLRVTGGRERIAHFIERGRDLVERIASQLTERLGAAQLLWSRVSREPYATVALRPGVARLLGEARAAGLTLAIATTTSRANVDALLAHALPAGARDWFAVVAGAEDAPRKKPDPQVYAVALDRLGVAAHECFAFEDSAAGLRAARAACVPTIVTVNDYTRDQEFGGALSVLGDFGERDRPATVVAGAPLRRGLVDVQQLRDWHAQYVR